MTTRLRRTHLILATGVTLLLGACSGASAPAATTRPTGAATAPVQAPTAAGATSAASTQPAGGGAAPGAAASPCVLLTQAEVDTAVGQPLGPGKQVATLQDCLWTTTDFTAGVDLTISDWAGIKGAATAGSKQPTAISGVGDEALNLNGSFGSNLYVRKGDMGFLLVINGPHVDGLPDHGLAQEKILAAAVLGRL